MRSFRTLTVWTASHELALETYRATARFPKEETYGLTSQMRRSAASIPTNIAEGCGTTSDAALGRFLQIAMGSASELEYEILLAADLGYFSTETANSLEQSTIKVKRMLGAFLSKIREDLRHPRPQSPDRPRDPKASPEPRTDR